MHWLKWLKSKIQTLKIKNERYPRAINEVVSIMVYPERAKTPRLARACPDNQSHRDIVSYAFVKNILGIESLIKTAGDDACLQGLDQQPIHFRGIIALQWHKLEGTRSHTTDFLVSMQEDPPYDIVFSHDSSTKYELFVPEQRRAWMGWLPGVNNKNGLVNHNTSLLFVNQTDFTFSSTTIRGQS